MVSWGLWLWWCLDLDDIDRIYVLMGCCYPFTLGVRSNVSWKYWLKLCWFSFDEKYQDVGPNSNKFNTFLWTLSSYGLTYYHPLSMIGERCYQLWRMKLGIISSYTLIWNSSLLKCVWVNNHISSNNSCSLT